MQLTLTIDMDNAAFDPEGDFIEREGEHTAKREYVNGAEPARILREIANEIGNCVLEAGTSYALYDINGNKVGRVEVT